MGQLNIILIYTYYTSEKEKEEMGGKYMKKFLRLFNLNWFLRLEKFFPENIGINRIRNEVNFTA